MSNETEIYWLSKTTISRRTMLALSAAGAVKAAISSCSSRRKSSGHPQSSNPSKAEEPDELENEGYDPRSGEPTNTNEPPPKPGDLPKAASVKTEYLPPVAHQYFGDCYAWSTIYGLATFYAAQKSQKPPTTPDLQAAPDY